MLKKLLLGAFLLPTASFAQSSEHWIVTKIDDNKGVVYYSNIGDIQSETMWSIRLSLGGIDGNSEPIYTLMNNLYDCQANNYKNLDMLTYDLDGNVLSTWSSQDLPLSIEAANMTRPKPIAPSSLDKKNYDIVCNANYRNQLETGMKYFSSVDEAISKTIELIVASNEGS